MDSENLTPENIAETLAGCGGILVPGGFGDRGIEGMILAAQYAREKGIPYFGICLGMQIAVIEFARHVAGWQDANSAEFSEYYRAPGHCPDAGAGGRDPKGRHHAAGAVSLCAVGGDKGPFACTGKRRSASGTATGMSSTTTSGVSCSRTA